MFAEVRLRFDKPVHGATFLQGGPTGVTKNAVLEKSRFADVPEVAVTFDSWSYSATCLTLGCPEGEQGYSYHVQCHLNPNSLSVLKDSAKNLLQQVRDSAKMNGYKISQIEVSLWDQRTQLAKGVGTSRISVAKKSIAEKFSASLVASLLAAALSAGSSLASTARIGVLATLGSVVAFLIIEQLRLQEIDISYVEA